MKLILEKHPELNRLTNYFSGIESLAEGMGIHVDDLVRDPSRRRQSLYLSAINSKHSKVKVKPTQVTSTLKLHIKHRKRSES